MSRTPSVRRPAVVAALCAAALALTGLTAAAPSAERVAAHSCQDTSLPVADRVDGPPARMTLDDRIGRMTGIEKDAPVPQPHLATHRVGSVLSGGDSTVSPSHVRTWADTYDSLRRTALGTPLGMPVIHGIDAVHGDNAVRGATIVRLFTANGTAGTPAPGCAGS